MDAKDQLTLTPNPLTGSVWFRRLHKKVVQKMMTEFGARVEMPKFQAARVPAWSFFVSNGEPCHRLTLLHCFGFFFSPLFFFIRSNISAASTRRFQTTTWLILLTSFIKMLVSFSSSTWTKSTNLRTMVLLSVIDQQNPLTHITQGTNGWCEMEQDTWATEKSWKCIRETCLHSHSQYDVSTWACWMVQAPAVDQI